MKKSLVTLSAACTGITLSWVLAIPAFASNGAQKAPLESPTIFSCPNGAVGGTPGFGFAVIKRNGNGTVAATVSLKGAAPDQTYSVALVQTPSCQADVIVTLTTNRQGNGTARVSEPQLPVTTGAFAVALSGSDSEFGTQNVTFG